MHCIALYCIALRCIALHCNAFAFALHCIAIHHITSRRKAKIALYTLHDIALHYIVLTYITLLSKALLLHFIGVIMLPVYAWDSRWFKMIQDDSSNHCIANFFRATIRKATRYMSRPSPLPGRRWPRFRPRGTCHASIRKPKLPPKWVCQFPYPPVLEVQFLVL